MSNTAPAATERLTDVRDMYVVHRVFRREFVLIPKLVRQVAAGDTARAGVVAGHARLVLAGLDMHHTGEDLLLLAEAARSGSSRRRARPPDGGAAPPGGGVDRPARRVPDQVGGRGPAGRARGSGRDLRRVPGRALEHLDSEERHILPIAARLITQEEWNSLGEHGMKKVKQSELPILFGAMLEEAQPDERSMMLALVPVPVRLLLRTVFAWQYRRYIKRVRTP